MKKTVTLLFVILISLACKNAEDGCESFKIGKFKQNLEEIGVNVYSTRTKDGFQRDSSKYGISRYKLTWKSDCNLEAQLIETTSEVSKKYIGRKYYVAIIKVLSEKEYIYQCHVDGNDFIDQDTIVKIN